MERNKKAFTLTSISIVAVVVSASLASILASRNFIMHAKINKIHQEYRMFFTAFSIFSDSYGCIPGDCAAWQVPDLLPKLPKHSHVNTGQASTAQSMCTTPNLVPGAGYIKLASNKIESTAKRTCAMYELQAAGYIEGLAVPLELESVDDLLNSVAGKHVPYARFSKTASWDFRTVTSIPLEKKANSVTFPASVSQGATLKDSPMAGWSGTIQLVLREAFSLSEAGLDFAPDGDIVSTAIHPARAAVTARFAQKLDSKFDDGLPYSGNIAAGRKRSSVAQYGVCTNIGDVDEQVAGNISPNAKYVKSSIFDNGCLIAFNLNIKHKKPDLLKIMQI